MTITAQPIEEHCTDPAALPAVFCTDTLAAFCKAAGDPLRLEILRVLRHNAYGVLELSQLFEVKQSGMSHHLKVLANAGLVATRREGNSIFYRRAPLPVEPALQELHRHLFATVDLLELSSALQQRVRLTNQERTKASREFFEQNADRFHANQDLIAGYAQYGEIVTDFLDATPVRKDVVLEVGPGEGGFLPNLSKRFSQVIALDTSDEMLSRSRKITAEQHLTNVQLVHGDTSLALEQQLRANCITLNMVLHHTPDPARILEDLAQLLTPGGVLLVTDLCHHDQSWAREACGDLWLGFEPNDLSNWASAAGLVEGESLYLAQRNGFQIQLRQFFKDSKH
ncbi:MAG TPA: metalloregulator ArsR/SmtB family transcription factor [Porticoccus sp.]|nr:metalloregulator ArsR/SmtB family transcription factor [Porticoccus sp.]